MGVVLGIGGRSGEAAAALSVNGQVVAAVSECSVSRNAAGAGVRSPGVPMAALAACLERAHLPAHAVTAIALADRGAAGAADVRALRRGLRLRARLNTGHARLALADALDEKPAWLVEGLRAQALQVAASSSAERMAIVIVDGVARRGSLFYKDGPVIGRVMAIAGVERLIAAAADLAARLGCAAGDGALDALERLGSAGDATFAQAFGTVIGWSAQPGFYFDESRLDALVAGAASGIGDLAQADSLHARVRQRRRDLAAGFCIRVHELAARLCHAAAALLHVDAVGLGGSVFGSDAVNTAVRLELGDRVWVAPVPEEAGGAIGAAVATDSAASRFDGLSLGPAFSEPEMKQTIENCRLDYVYEPAWERLLTRVSRLLESGKTIAWFQGALDFGARSLGSRSILCDPSRPYARENLTHYLGRPTDEAWLPVSLTDAAADACLEAPLRSPFMLLRGTVRPEARPLLRAALDARNAMTVHTVDPAQAPELAELLRIHRTRTGVPGLINTPLTAHGEPTACAPRDAIRTTFSSAIDALVMGRFLMMKDYWLLRSDTDV